MVKIRRCFPQIPGQFCTLINNVGYVLGLARNKRLQRALSKEMEAARLACECTGEAARCFRDFRYRTRNSRSCERRVIGKAEYLPGKANPRFVVTSLSSNEADAQSLYEERYCARGEMENRIKEQQRGLFADRTSSATLRANQLRLYFSSFAYVLLHGLRLTARKVWLSFSEAYPYASDIAPILANLKQHPAWSPPG